MTTNRQRVIEHLNALAQRLRELLNESVQTPSMAALLREEETIDDAGVMRDVGWLVGYAELAGFDNVPDMLCAADISDQLLDQIERGLIEAPAPETAPEPAAARVYKAILDSLQTVMRSRLDRMNAIIIRSADAPIIDELARNAAHSVVAELGV